MCIAQFAIAHRAVLVGWNQSKKCKAAVATATDVFARSAAWIFFASYKRREST